MTSDKTLLYLNFFGGRLWESINIQSMRELEGRGYRIEYWNVGKYRFPRTNVRDISEFNRIQIKRKGNGLKASYDFDALLASEGQSFFRWQEPRGLLHTIYRKNYRRRMNEFGREFRRVLNSQHFDLVVIPNGRTAVMALAKKICESLKIRVLFLETNSGFAVRNGRFFLESFPPHARDVRQQPHALEERNEKRDFHLFREWLSRRANSKTLFEEALLVDYDEIPCAIYKPDDGISIAQKWNVFFTSSSDEHWNAGPEWELDEWLHQYEAYNQIITTLKEGGETDFVLRIHPDLAKKHPQHVKNEINKIHHLSRNHPDLRIVGPLSKLSAYDLIASSRRVIVTLSTVGLEASGIGRPVWCTKPTYYDETADVRKLWSKTDVSSENLQLYTVDPSKTWGLFGRMYDTGVAYRKDTPRGHGSQRIESIINLDLPFRLASMASRWNAARKSRKMLSIFELEQPRTV